MGSGGPTPLVGRDVELGELERARAVAAFDEPGAIEVVGEPGIGKSRLLGELADRCRRDGWLVLEGRASEFEREVPFAVWIDALEDHVLAHAPEAAATLDQLLGAAAAPVPSERFRTHRAVRALLAALAADRPLLVVLDDQQWADGASLELLAHLLRRPPVAAVLLALAHRPGADGAALRAVLRPHAARRPITRIALGPLDRAAAAALLTDVAEPVLRARLHADSGGNPLFLQELARAAARGGAAALPPAVASAVGDALRGLPAALRTAAHAAAVAGEPVDAGLAAAAAGCDDLAPELDALAAHDVLRAGPDGGLRFRHPVVHRAVHEDAPPAWRQAAHARVEAELARRGAPAPARAAHVVRSGRRDDAAAAVLADAGHATAGRAPTVAAHWYGAALDMLGDRHPRRLVLLVARAAARANAGELAASREDLHAAQALLPHGDPGRLRVVALCAKLEHLLGRHAEGRALLQAALADAGRAPPADVAALQIELAANSFFTADFADQRTWARLAHRTARACGAPELVAAATVYLAGAEYVADDVPAALSLAEDAARRVDALDDGRLGARADAVGWLGWVELYLERLDDAARHLDRALALARAAGRGGSIVFAQIARSGVERWRGRLPAALEAADEAVDGALLVDRGPLLTWALTARADAALLCGDVDGAVAAAQEAIAHDLG
ncbi:MAG TPA: ATP-binding protein, partial [Baekduia sp.]|nr:ATP-binding protein [Baekduia sp.]